MIDTRHLLLIDQPVWRERRAHAQDGGDR